MRAPLTVKGAARLREELEHLKSVKRPAVINAIAEARAHGDLKENAEYHAAKEQQGITEARMADLEDKLSRADIIDVSKLKGDQVMFGATVTLIDEDTDDKVKYRVVGEVEADVKKGKISITSPLARALLGKRKNNIVEVSTPGGGKSYKVLKVEFK
jgi:transcription elongation factor GreA